MQTSTNHHGDARDGTRGQVSESDSDVEENFWRSIIPNKTTESILNSFQLPTFIEPPRRRAPSRSPVSSFNLGILLWLLDIKFLLFKIDQSLLQVVRMLFYISIETWRIEGQIPIIFTPGHSLSVM